MRGRSGQPPALTRPDVGDAMEMQPPHTLCILQDMEAKSPAEGLQLNPACVIYLMLGSLSAQTLHFFCFVACIPTTLGRTEQGKGSRWQGDLQGMLLSLGDGEGDSMQAAPCPGNSLCWSDHAFESTFSLQ